MAEATDDTDCKRKMPTKRAAQPYEYTDADRLVYRIMSSYTSQFVREKDRQRTCFIWDPPCNENGSLRNQVQRSFVTHVAAGEQSMAFLPELDKDRWTFEAFEEVVHSTGQRFLVESKTFDPEQGAGEMVIVDQPSSVRLRVYFVCKEEYNSNVMLMNHNREMVLGQHWHPIRLFCQGFMRPTKKPVQFGAKRVTRPKPVQEALATDESARRHASRQNKRDRKRLRATSSEPKPRKRRKSAPKES